MGGPHLVLRLILASRVPLSLQSTQWVGGGARQATCALEEASEGSADLGDAPSLYPNPSKQELQTPPHPQLSSLLCYLIHPNVVFGPLVGEIRLEPTCLGVLKDSELPALTLTMTPQAHAAWSQHQMKWSKLLCHFSSSDLAGVPKWHLPHSPDLAPDDLSD